MILAPRQGSSLFKEIEATSNSTYCVYPSIHLIHSFHQPSSSFSTHHHLFPTSPHLTSPPPSLSLSTPPTPTPHQEHYSTIEGDVQLARTYFHRPRLLSRLTHIYDLVPLILRNTLFDIFCQVHSLSSIRPDNSKYIRAPINSFGNLNISIIKPYDRT
ncbi:hypothetical protein EYC84_000086 [Monilinia fructicola]|uniref:Uncharacterized protein n=1 Tax=Monilinia fructicola TaxID=38448 RepID=A0A5M9JMG5_MONFR|nr:hypothetical protein EYC84_000086 [Monilinia fructicola]